MPSITQLGDSESWSRDSLKNLKMKYSELEKYVRAGVIKKAIFYSEREEKERLAIFDVKSLSRYRTTECLQLSSKKEEDFKKIYSPEQTIRDCYEVFVNGDVVLGKFFRRLFAVTHSSLSNQSNSPVSSNKISYLTNLSLTSFSFYKDYLLSIEKQTERDPIRSTNSLLKILNDENKKLSKSLDNYINFIYKNQ